MIVQQTSAYGCVAKLIHDDCYPVAMLFCQNSPSARLAGAFVIGVLSTDLRKVDFPAPKKPHIMVRGTRAWTVDTVSGLKSEASIRVLITIRYPTLSVQELDLTVALLLNRLMTCGKMARKRA